MTEPTHSHYHPDMLSVEEARDIILSSFNVLDSIHIPLEASLGMVISDDISSPIDIPPMDNSAMDGYAVRSEDIQSASEIHPVTLSIVGTIPAGEVPEFVVVSGTGARIMTGAPIPKGADSVVPFEETTESTFNQSEVHQNIGIFKPSHEGNYIRAAGGDVQTGQTVLSRGTDIHPQTISFLASMGLNMVPVYRKPEVAVLSTGNELIEPGKDLTPGKIFDSNTLGIMASIEAAGGKPKNLGIVQDNLSDLESKIHEAMASDLVVTSAGVSVGDYDIVKEALARQGVLNFWSVRMRPAKPLAFGMLTNEESGRKTPLIGLPGNPVSSLIAFEQFCRPSIRKMIGKKHLARPTIEATLTDHIYNYDGRRVYARVTVKRDAEGYKATTTGSQGSNILSSMAMATGLAICPEGDSEKEPGDSVTVVMLHWPEEQV